MQLLINSSGRLQADLQMLSCGSVIITPTDPTPGKHGDIRVNL